MTTDDEPVYTVAEDHDLADGDSLLDVPLSKLRSTDSIRSLGLVLVALAVLVWPNRTDRVLALLVGVGLVAVTVTTIVDLARHPERRDFGRILGVGVGGGLAASLVLHPDESLESIVQLGGVVVAGAAAVEVGRILVHRRASVLRLARAVGLAVAAVLLLVYPDDLLVGLTSVVAALVGTAGLIQLFSDGTYGATAADGSADGASRPGIRATLLGWIRRRPDMAEDRDVMFGKVFFEGPSASIRYARFAALMVLATVIASLGVVVESTAVVIGAMLIAPLMTPLMGTALSFTMAWPRRLRRSAGIAVSGVGMALVTGVLIGAVVPRAVDVTGNSEIASRTSPTIIDLGIAVAAGVAGAYALARRDVSDSLPGVAVAIALVPPLAVTGLCWEQQAWGAGNGAFLLFLTNAVAIVIAGGATFVAVGAAPLEQAWAGQQRIQTAITGVLALGGVVVLLLLLNGNTLARAELARGRVESALADWSSEHQEVRIIGRRTLSDGTIVIDMAGPGRPPDLDQLLASLQDALGGDTTLRVTWIEQQQVTLGDG